MKGNCCDAWHQQLIPSCIQGIGFILNGNIRSFLDPAASIERSFVLGQIQKPVTAYCKEDLELIIILFRPTGMYRLFEIPMQPFSDRGTDFELICSRQDRLAVQRIFECDTTKKAVVAIETLLMAKLPEKALPYQEQIEYASHFIYCNNGNSPVHQLAREMNMSKRNFERHFIGQVGISPKRFSCIVRIKKTLQLIEQYPALAWKDISQKLDYTDQAHFFHEFKKFTGTTPNEYLRSITHFEHFLYAG